MNYVYALVDTSKEVNIETTYGIIKYKPFYIGKGTYTKVKTERYNVHYFDAIHYRNINTYKENKIRKLLKTNNFSTEIIINIDDPILTNKIEIELITLLGRRCIDDKGLLTNISEGGEGGYVWKDNPIAVENIRKANKNKWKGENNPNSSKNRKLENTPSHIRSLTGNHWNKGKFKVLYEVYDSFTLNSFGVFNSFEINEKFNICMSTLGASIIKGIRIKNKYFIRKTNTNLRVKIKSLNLLIDDGIVRTAWITCLNNEYAEIDRNNLSPLREE